MCGSGTLAIEAAMLATNRRPGLYRTNYSYMHFLGYDESVHRQEVAKLKSQVREVPGLIIVASDNREDAISISKVNAGIAGVEHLIQFQVCDFEETDLPESPGVIYFNPEYGERLGEISAAGKNIRSHWGFFKKEMPGIHGLYLYREFRPGEKNWIKSKPQNRILYGQT